MVIAGYVISFVTGVAVGFVFAAVILFRDKLNLSRLTETKEQGSIFHLFSHLRFIMSESRSPTDCKSYPFCEHLKSVLENVAGDLIITRTIVLQREAESVCAHCPYFEPRPYLG